MILVNIPENFKICFIHEIIRNGLRSTVISVEYYIDFLHSHEFPVCHNIIDSPFVEEAKYGAGFFFALTIDEVNKLTRVMR